MSSGVPIPQTVIPTEAGYISWIFGVMGVPSAWLMDDDPIIQLTYDLAVTTVNQYFLCVSGPLYALMVYNLAGHFLAMWAQDTTTSPPQPYVVVDSKSYGFWAYLRYTNNINGFTTGIVTSSSNDVTSVGLTVPDQVSNLTLGQLQLTTTPWGRFYLGYAQDFGTAWGIS